MQRVGAMKLMSDRMLFRAVDRWIWRTYPELADWVVKTTEKHDIPLPSVAFPVSQNDKFCWRKVFETDPRLPVVTDKLLVREWLTEEGIACETPEVLWFGKTADKVPKRVWRASAVLKASNAWNANAFAPIPKKRRPRVIGRLNGKLKSNLNDGLWTAARFFASSGWIFAEERLDAAEMQELKFYTYGSRILQAFRSLNRDGERYGQIWERQEDGTYLLAERSSSAAPLRCEDPLPETFAKAEALAKEIGQRFDHMRVDFLLQGDKVYLGELTPLNQRGVLAGIGHETEGRVAEIWDIRESWTMKNRAGPLWKRYYFSRLRACLDAGLDYSDCRDPSLIGQASG